MLVILIILNNKNRNRKEKEKETYNNCSYKKKQLKYIACFCDKITLMNSIGFFHQQTIFPNSKTITKSC